MSEPKAREFWQDAIGSRFSILDRAQDWITRNPSWGPLTHYREVLPDDELEKLRAENKTLREAAAVLRGALEQRNAYVNDAALARYDEIMKGGE
jgi:hypothetical protein